MSGEFVHHECERCQGFGQVPSVSLWDDLVACPDCDGGGVLYEYSAGEEDPMCGECGAPAIGLCRGCEEQLGAEADYYANEGGV